MCLVIIATLNKAIDNRLLDVDGQRKSCLGQWERRKRQKKYGTESWVIYEAQNTSEEASGYKCSLFAVEMKRFEIFKSETTTFIYIKQQNVYLCWVDHVSRMEDIRLQFCEIRTWNILLNIWLHIYEEGSKINDPIYF